RRLDDLALADGDEEIVRAVGEDYVNTRAPRDRAGLDQLGRDPRPIVRDLDHRAPLGREELEILLAVQRPARGLVEIEVGNGHGLRFATSRGPGCDSGFRLLPWTPARTRVKRGAQGRVSSGAARDTSGRGRRREMLQGATDSEARGGVLARR